MANSVYAINKGINKPIEFKGLKAKYIWYLGGAVVALLLLFAILYIAGINTYICLSFIIIAGILSFARIYHLSNKYGEHGMMKKMARDGIPRCVKSRSRNTFITLIKR